MNRTTGLFKYIPIPREHKPDIFSIDYEKLFKWGFKYILFDYDYTLTAWKNKKITSETINLLDYLDRYGFIVAVVTNSNLKNTIHIEGLTEGKVKVYANMKKPSTKKLKEVMVELGAKNEDTVIVGDLFITDVIVGNRLGLYSILINPLIYEIDSNFKKLAAKISKIVYKTFFWTIGWFFKLMDLAIPNEFVNNIFEIDYEKLKNTKHNLIIFDFDNTLVPWKTKVLTDEVKELMYKLKSMGFDILIASNGKDSRFDLIKDFFSELDVKVQTWSLKPFNFKIMKNVKKTNHKPKDCVLIGDQLFTDIIAGNVSGFYTIKVNPVSENESRITKFNRIFERLSLKIMRNKPSIYNKEKEK